MSFFHVWYGCCHYASLYYASASVLGQRVTVEIEMMMREESINMVAWVKEIRTSSQGQFSVKEMKEGRMSQREPGKGKVEGVATLEGYWEGPLGK